MLGHIIASSWFTPWQRGSQRFCNYFGCSGGGRRKVRKREHIRHACNNANSQMKHSSGKLHRTCVPLVARLRTYYILRIQWGSEQLTCDLAACITLDGYDDDYDDADVDADDDDDADADADDADDDDNDDDDDDGDDDGDDDDDD
eukprot:2413934-Pyramimonas_sp.AAC.2